MITKEQASKLKKLYEYVSLCNAKVERYQNEIARSNLYMARKEIDAFIDSLTESNPS